MVKYTLSTYKMYTNQVNLKQVIFVHIHYSVYHTILINIPQQMV